MSIRAATQKRLFALSGNQCAFPKCTTPIIDGSTVLGEMCHIKAANAQGPRYDATQTEAERDDYDNLILLCPTHHTVIDDDLESYSVERLQRMKTQHESGVTALSETEAASGAILLIDKSVHTNNQTGGLAAQSVTAGTINIMSGSPANDRTAQSVENLWQIILDLKAAFSDLMFVEMISTPLELDDHFAGRRGHPLFDSLEAYQAHDTVINKMNSAKFATAERERPFISLRLWSIYSCIQAMYGRYGALTMLSFKRGGYQDWRTDTGIDQYLRSVWPSQNVDSIKQGNYALQTVIGWLETLFTDVVWGDTI